MATETVQGTVNFVNHEKNYITIAYELNGKKKTINGPIDAKEKHFYQIGDVVAFVISLSARGDKMVATQLAFRYNNALDVLLNKAKTENSFTGYLKEAGGNYFVKEIASYIFFPVMLSPWQLLPDAGRLNEPVRFLLEHIEKREKVTARLFDNTYIPEFYTAVKIHKAGTAVEAVVAKLSPHAIYLDVVGTKIMAKLPVPHKNPVKPGDKIAVRITYLSPFRIVVEPV
jgi:ribosomal protein S1